MLLAIVGFILQSKLESSVNQATRYDNFVVDTLTVSDIL